MQTAQKKRQNSVY